MNPNDISRLLLRVTGLFAIAYTITIIPLEFEAAVLWTSRGQPAPAVQVPSSAFISVVPLLVALAIGGLLWWAGRPRTSDHRKTTQIGLKNIEEIAVFALGIFFAGSGLVRFIGIAINVFANDVRVHYPLTVSELLAYPSISYGIVQLLVGIPLVVGHRGIVALRHKINSLRPMANPEDREL
jgi:hypothetical protein